MPAPKNAPYPPTTLPDLNDPNLHVVKVLEAGGLLRIGRHPLYEAVRSGEIPTVKIGSRCKVPASWLRTQLGITPNGAGK